MKIFKLIAGAWRGAGTPLWIVIACALGAMLGFAPPPAVGPGLLVSLLVLAFFLNINLALFLVGAVFGSLLAGPLEPASFAVGRILLEGPTEELFRTAVNAPFLALFGLEYYVVSGGQLIGLVLGGGLGAGLAVLARRRCPAPCRWFLFGDVERDPRAFRLVSPVRPVGLVVGGALALIVWLLQATLGGAVLHDALQASLEGLNGATVDVGAVDLDLGQGRLAIAGLAMADPEDLSRDLLATLQLEADINQEDLLRKRVHIDRLVITGAFSGRERGVPGVRLGPPREPEPEIEPGEKTLDDYLAEAQIWQERLSQARRWIEEWSAGADAPEETREQRIEREVRELGYAGVRAEHLLEETPQVQIGEVVVEGLEAGFLPGRSFDIRASSISDRPDLVQEAPRLELTSRDRGIGLAIDLASLSAGGGEGGLAFHWRGLPLDAALAQLSLAPGQSPVGGGTLDLEFDGPWSEAGIGWIDTALKATLRDTTFRLGDSQASVSELELPIGLRGPLDGLRVSFDQETLADALTEAGKQELAQRVRERADELLGDELQGELDEVLGEELGDQLGNEFQGLLQGVLGGQKKDDD